jgi:hypothetical protein
MNDTPEDFQEYFLKKFEKLFIQLILSSISAIDSSEKNNDLLKIDSYIKGNKKINYSKIMLNMSNNNKLMETLTTLEKFDFEDKTLITAAKKYNDIWFIMPSLNVLQILFGIKITKNRKIIYQIILKMYSCSCAYKEIINRSEQSFNPNLTITAFTENYGLTDIIPHTEIKTPDTYEFMIDLITNKLLNDKSDSELNDEINNMTDDDITNSTNNLNKLLMEKINEGNNSAIILTNIVGKLNNKLKNLKNEKNNNKNNDKNDKKKGFDKIYDVVKEIHDELSTIDKTTVNPIELWDTTIELSSQSIHSPALDAIGSMIKKQIFNNINNIKQTKEELKNEVDSVIKNIENK